MEKLKMHSPNLTQENIRKIMELFPNCVTEVKGIEDTEKDENISSVVKYAIDFDLLRQELSESIVEGQQERYHLNWPGKRESLLTANAPIAKTLRPCREESVNFDKTENLFIEGDNLDALKLLQETYLGKVKMIYIDPPYNTGNDFIYEDDFAENAQEFLLKSGQKDEEGNRLIANTESNGRFHSDWLSMMYPRLKLARNLLRDDGVIFIQIDDNELYNLVHICNEIFGGENFIASLCVQMSYVSGEKMAHIDRKPPKIKEFVLMYARNKTNVILNPQYRPRDISPEYNKYLIKNCSTNPTDWEVIALSTQLKKCEITEKTKIETFMFENAELIFNRVRSKNEEFLKTRDIEHPVRITTRTGLDKLAWHGRECVFLSSKIGKDGKGNNVYMEALGDIWDDINITNIYQEGDISFKNGKKPLKLLTRLVNYICHGNDICLDFFAGSATTAHAVMQLNAEDGGKRKFIMVQLPESCDENSEAFKAGYRTIAEISKERIRRAGRKIKDDNATTVPDLDVGFRVLKVDSSNMSDVYYTPDKVEQRQLSFFTENIKDDRSSEDLLFQVLLDWGVDLTLPITKEIISNREVFFVDGNALIACFVKDGQITEEFCKELAERKPLRIVFRDSGFKDDSVKINVEQIFKLISPHTDVKTI